MTPFEKEYKERFKDASSLEGLEPDAIWCNIANALPEEEGDKGIAWLRKRYGLLGVLLLLAVGMGYFKWYSYANEKPAALESAHHMAEQILSPNTNGEPSKPTIHKNVNDEIVVQPAIGLDNSELNAPTVNGSLNTTSTTFSAMEETPLASSEIQIRSKQYPETNTKANFKNNPPSESRVMKATIANTEKSQVPKKTSPEPLGADTPITEKTTVAPEVADENTRLKNADAVENNSITKPEYASAPQSFWLPSLHQQGLFLASDENNQANKKTTIPQANKGRNRKLQLAITAGVISKSDRYANTNLGNALSKAGSTAPGQSLSLQVQWQFTKQLYLSTGLEWLHTQTRFDYSTQWDTLAVVRGYEMFGEIDAIAIRTVRQHNQQTIFTLPLLIGTAKNFGTLTLGLDVGIGLNYIYQQKGKTLNDEQVIVAYDAKNNNTLPYADFYLSYQIEPYLSYSLTERFGLRLKPTLRFQQHGTSKLYEEKLSSLLWGLSAGAVVGF